MSHASNSSLTTKTSGEGTSARHTTLMEVGLDAVGASTSFIVKTWVSVPTFPQASTYVHVRVTISGQVLPFDTSEPETMPPSQLST